MTLFEIFEKIVMVLSPIIVAFFGWRSAVTSKQTREFIELEKKYKESEKERAEQEAKLQQEKITAISKQVESLQSTVQELSDSLDLKPVYNQLDKITEISQVNYDYSLSLSQVICAIGKCIESNNLGSSDAVTKALEEHTKCEKAISQRMCKIAF